MTFQSHRLLLPSSHAPLYLAQNPHLGAVYEVPTVSMTDDSTVLDVEHLAFILDLIQDTVRYIGHGLADIQVVGSEDGELLSCGAAAVGQFLVRVVRMGVVVLKVLVLEIPRLWRDELTGTELLALCIEPATAEESDLDLVIGVCVRTVTSSCWACCGLGRHARVGNVLVAGLEACCGLDQRVRNGFRRSVTCNNAVVCSRQG
jgi:hypothetical protein